MTTQENQTNTHKIYICSMKTWVPVTEEVYLEYYGSMTLMVFPLLVWEFGFASVEEFILRGGDTAGPFHLLGLLLP